MIKLIPIYVCEDDPKQLEKLSKIISHSLIIYEWDMKLACVTTSPYELLEAMNHVRAESAVYILDVDLKCDMDGIELAVEIRKTDPRAFIFFVTTHDEMAITTFQYKVEPLDYIIKEDPDFTERLLNCLRNVYEKYQIPNNPILDTISVLIEKRIFIIALDDIFFVGPSPNAHKLLVHKEGEILEFNSSLKEFQKKLDERFAFCHKAYIVNIRNIDSIDKKTLLIHLKNGESCPCSVRMFSSICKLISEKSDKHS